MDLLLRVEQSFIDFFCKGGLGGGGTHENVPEFKSPEVGVFVMCVLASF